MLTGGTYFFSDLRLVGNARLIVRGASKIYVTGRLDLGGGSVINESGKAADLRIFAPPPYHYDKALLDEGANSGATLERLYWRDLNPPRR